MKSFLEYVLVESEEDDPVVDEGIFTRKKKPSGPTPEEREESRRKENADLIARLHAARGTKPKKGPYDPTKQKGTPGTDHPIVINKNPIVINKNEYAPDHGEELGEKDDVLQHAIDKIQRTQRRFDKAAERRARTQRSFGPKKNPRHSTMASAFLKAKLPEK